ncbi:MAG TPA: class III extradiol ring-cleavage dioxygenase [Aliidongia sp.]|uniref:DODA-type extradiol aromatic ring-opening family dioxygenase n=1 Tax=Aliidongia sp. TaxID=1914230 RepID=UPI002DDCECBD|nr:class III extradiol ring-cleavage dioxygenase [Aliidongia sp.]HEV2674510.1 class III extradiol ring-cleavage dioxygenase [Aliidongia sp.]
MTDKRLPTLFIPHGGGPCFFMEPPRHGSDPWKSMGDHLRAIAADIGRRPRAILVISAHWEEARPTVTTGAAPPLLYDYYGFPAHTYQLRYPAPGEPQLAAEIGRRLDEAGLPSGGDAARGFDHGVFVPFLLIYPEADIPVVQLSLDASLDPARHLAIGRALQPLRDAGVLIVGSGLSFHNLRGFFGEDPRIAAEAEAFDGWLTRTATDPDPAARDAALAQWAEAPGARTSHPREEHLLPLMVAAGAAGSDIGVRTYSDHVFGKAVSSYRFG